MNIDVPEGWVQVNTECQTNPDLFFSDDEASKSIAKDTCLSCPVKSACKQTAIDNREKHGIWGGTDFKTFRLPKLDTEYCRAGKHKLPKDRKNNQCKACADERQRAYQKRQSREKTPRYLKKLENDRGRKKKRHQNVIGGLCKDGHPLSIEGTDYFIRTYDKAVVCKKCIHKPKNPIGLGDQNSGSRNHG